MADDHFIEQWDRLASKIHMTACEKGWWGSNRNDGECIALMHSELSEALEALRRGNPADEHLPELTSLEVELADTIIRIMDYGAAHGLRISDAIVAKANFNDKRPYRHGKSF